MASMNKCRARERRLHSVLLDRRRFLNRAAAVAAATALGSTAAQVVGTCPFDVVRVRTALPGLGAPLRIAWLTELHHGQFVRTASVRAWVDAGLGEAPDLDLLGGDLVDHTPGPTPPAAW